MSRSIHIPGRGLGIGSQGSNEVYRLAAQLADDGGYGTLPLGIDAAFAEACAQSLLRLLKPA